MHHHHNERELPMLAGIGALIHWCEELASLLAGSILTAGLGIALINLLTDGKLLNTAPALLFVWAASQSVGLDAQLVGTAAKLGRAIRRRAVWAIVGYLPLVGALGYVGYLASNVFATQQAYGLTTAEALARLGMDGATWIIERSILAVVLVILSGLLRYTAPAPAQISLEEEREKLQRELELEPMRQRLRAQQVGGWRAVAQTALQGAGVAQTAQIGTDDPVRFEATGGLPTVAPEANLSLPHVGPASSIAVSAPPATPTVDEQPARSPDSPPDSPDDDPGGGLSTAVAATPAAPMPPAPIPFVAPPARRPRKPAAVRQRERAAAEALAQTRRQRAFEMLDADPTTTPNAIARELHCRWRTAYGYVVAWQQRQESRAV